MFWPTLKERLDLILNVTFYLSSISEENTNQPKSKENTEGGVAEVTVLSGFDYLRCVCKRSLVLRLFPDLCKANSRNETCFPSKPEGGRPWFAAVVACRLEGMRCIQLWVGLSWRKFKAHIGKSKEVQFEKDLYRDMYETTMYHSLWTSQALSF